MADSNSSSVDDYIFEFENDYIFVATEVSEKTTIEDDDALEENCMTVYVKTINGKTVSINATMKRKHEKKTILEQKLRSKCP